MFGLVHALVGYAVGFAAFRWLGLKGEGDGFLAALLGAAPDIDYFSPLPFGHPLGHHGILHSPLLLTLGSLPLLWTKRSRAVPYYLALMSHVVADFVDNVVPIFSPLAWDQVGMDFALLSPWWATILELMMIVLFLTLVSRVKHFPIILPERYGAVSSLTLAVLVLISPFLLSAIPLALSMARSYTEASIWIISSLVVVAILLLNAGRAVAVALRKPQSH